MSEFVRYNYNDCEYKKGDCNSLEFIGMQLKNSKSMIKELCNSNNIEKCIDLLINHLDEVRLVQADEVYKCKNCEAVERESCVTMRRHKQIVRKNMYCKRCGSPMELVEATNSYK